MYQEDNTNSSTIIQDIYTAIWGTSHNVVIAFDVPLTNTKLSYKSDIYQSITLKEMKDCNKSEIIVHLAQMASENITWAKQTSW
jgi:hypothetical protein